MSNAAIHFEAPAIRSPRLSARDLAGFAIAAAALAPLAIVAFGLIRGGVEPYIVLAALLLG